MHKIYVSSTYKDLKNCRQKVNDAIRMLGHVDVAMEHYVAEPRSSVTKCLSDVANADVYVGVFARRYGWIPPGQKFSITELEYREAVKFNKDILLFMVDQSLPNWPYSDPKGSEDERRVNTLWSELTSGKYMQSVFSSCEELQVKVTASIANLSNPLLTPTDLEREEKLLLLINKKDVTASIRSKQALVDMGSTRYGAILHNRLSKPSKNIKQRIEDIRELMEITSRNKSVMPLLKLLLRSENPTTRSQVIQELGQRALAGKQLDSDTAEIILDLGRDKDATVRREVAHSIWKIFRLFDPIEHRKLFEKMKLCLLELSRDKDKDVNYLANYSRSTLNRQGIF